MWHLIFVLHELISLLVVYEIQRLFAFLYYSNRRYVSVTNVVRAAQASGNIAGTELTNARPEGRRSV